MKKISKVSIVLFILFGCNIFSFAQSQTSIGVSSLFESTKDHLLCHSYGINIEKQFTRHIGFDIGLNSKSYIYNFMNINYVSVPVGVKFNSKIANLTLGFEPNFYRNVELNNNLTYTDNTSLDMYKFSYFTKVSKQFMLTSKFVFEPEIKLNLFNPVTVNEFNLGLGLKIKYIL